MPLPNNSCLKVYGSSYALTNCVTDTDIQARSRRRWAARTTGRPVLATSSSSSRPRASGRATQQRERLRLHRLLRLPQLLLDHRQPARPLREPALHRHSGVSPSVAGDCDSGQQPNGNWADETISVASHEQNETITDPLINAWYYGDRTRSATSAPGTSAPLSAAPQAPSTTRSTTATSTTSSRSGATPRTAAC